MNKLQRALEEQKQSTKQETPRLSGLLGMPLGGSKVVEVSGRNAYVYVRLRNNQSEVIQAFNNQVAPSYNLPVIVERQGNKYVVLGVDTERYENNWNSFSAYLPRHGNTHSFDIESGGGGDIVWVYPRQFMPLLVFPSGSLGGPDVIVSSYTLKRGDGTWAYVGNTGTSNITSYNPSSSTGAIMVLVYLDANSGNPYLLIGSGTVFNNIITGSSQIYQYIPQITDSTTQIPLAAVRLITGTSAISWDNIYDVRQWLHTSPTGTGGGAGSVAVQDEGVAQGSATTFNFVGDNVQATVAGSVARIFITGSIGGGINTGTLDARYLKLDASNDPVTGPLDVTVYESYAGYFTSLYTYAGRFDLAPTGTPNPMSNPAVYISRGSWNNQNVKFTGIILDTEDYDASGTYLGGVLRYRDSGGTERLYLNPNSTGTLPNYIYDTTISRPTGTVHTSWRELGNERAYLDVSGTFHSNGSPLVKEAPANGQLYVRKNAGWEQQHINYLPFGIYTNISPITAAASPGFPYATTVERTYTFAKWSQGCYVGGTNNGSNFWTLDLIRWSDNAVIASLTTSGSAGSTHLLLSTTTFAIPSVENSYVGVVVRATAVGAPASIYIVGPALEITT